MSEGVICEGFLTPSFFEMGLFTLRFSCETLRGVGQNKSSIGSDDFDDAIEGRSQSTS